MEIFFIFFSILWAFVCYHIAKKNGRDKYFAIFLGVFLGIVAVIGYLLAGETEQKKRERVAEIARAIAEAKKE